MFIGAICCAAAAVLAVLYAAGYRNEPESALLLMILGLVVGVRPIRIPALRTEVSASDPFVFTAIAYIGGFPAACVNILAVLGAALLRSPRPKVEKLAFNVGALVLCTGAGYGVYRLLGGVPGGPLVDQFIPLTLGATAYFVVNTGLVTAVITVDHGGDDFLSIWAKSGLWTGVSAYVGLTLAGCLLLILQVVGPMSLALGVPPCWMILKFYRTHKEKIEAQQREIERVVDHNAELEEMVAARTAALQESNRHLREANDGLAEANRAKGAFLANMSHELRTPLNAIIGFSDLMRQGACGAVNSEQVECLQDIHNSGYHLLGLINDILDLSKIEAGRLEVHITEVDVRDAVLGAAGMLKVQASKKNQKLAVDSPNRGLVAGVDPGMFRQVLVNLLSNAVKFTPEGGNIDVMVSRNEDDLEVAIRDTGIGIDPAVQDKIFHEFFQVDGTYSRNYEGTGLGLALVRRMVELHGGTITLESVPGQGTTFTLVFPGSIVDATEAPVEAAPAAQVPVDLEGTRVLVVEDNPVNRKLAHNLLKSRGFEVIEAETGEEALAILKHATLDLVLMDIQLPGMDGLEVTRRIKSDPDTATLPVVAVSAHAMEEDRRKAVEAGCDAYIAKPIQLNRLAEDLASVLRVASPMAGTVARSSMAS
jgi:signal transduction histidine kinase/ActR/RegA family two-component response regulator